MSRKYVLVPHDIYKDTKRAEARVLQPMDALTETKNNIREIIEDKSIDESTKNILYNQELLNLLKQQRELKEKPMKVEITRKKVIPPNFVPTISFVKNIPGARASTPPAGGPIGPMPLAGGPTPSRKRLHKTLAHDVTSAHSPSHSTIAEEEEEEVEEETVPKTPKFPDRRKVILTIQEQKIEDKAKALLKDIFESGANYELGVLENGKLFNPDTGNIYKAARDYDSLHAMKKILGHSASYSPPGFNTFRDLVLNDPYLNKEVGDFISTIQKRGPVKAPGKTPTSIKMSGRGFSGFRFKPRNWI